MRKIPIPNLFFLLNVKLELFFSKHIVIPLNSIQDSTNKALLEKSSESSNSWSKSRVISITPTCSLLSLILCALWNSIILSSTNFDTIVWSRLNISSVRELTFLIIGEVSRVIEAWLNHFPKLWHVELWVLEFVHTLNWRGLDHLSLWCSYLLLATSKIFHKFISHDWMDSK